MGKGIPAVAKGLRRKWVKCKTCGRASFYDYVPYSLSNAIHTKPCGHMDYSGSSEWTRMNVLEISEAEARQWFAKNQT